MSDLFIWDRRACFCNQHVNEDVSSLFMMYLCMQGSSSWWTAMTEKEWTRQGRNCPECSLRTNSEMPCCSFLQINRWACVSASFRAFRFSRIHKNELKYQNWTRSQTTSNIKETSGTRVKYKLNFKWPKHLHQSFYFNLSLLWILIFQPREIQNSI